MQLAILVNVLLAKIRLHSGLIGIYKSECPGSLFPSATPPCVPPPASELAGHFEPALTFAENELRFLDFM